MERGRRPSGRDIDNCCHCSGTKKQKRQSKNTDMHRSIHSSEVRGDKMKGETQKQADAGRRTDPSEVREGGSDRGSLRGRARVRQARLLPFPEDDIAPEEGRSPAV